MIASVGLLTVEGIEHFYDIFEDYENMGSKKREPEAFLWNGLPPYQGERGKKLIKWENNRKTLYRNWLKKVSISFEIMCEKRRAGSALTSTSIGGLHA